MPTNEGFSGVSNCYVFKSRLQEYAQKVGLPTPVYETIKEGPSHEPCFRSTVIVNDVRYDSLPGFFNRKAAEQSAAEVALLELAKRGEVNECISQPVHETGLCKNLLQEYAQKMNYAIPLYQCRKDEAPGKVHFTCTVEIGGIRYIGAAAKTKKEAEIKAARTALLAIQELSVKSVGDSQLTVIPCRKRGPAELANKADETANVPKAKKCRFKKKVLKNKHIGGRTEHSQVQGTGSFGNMRAGHKVSKTDQTHASGFQLAGAELLAREATMNYQEERSDIEPIEREIAVVNDALCHRVGCENDLESVHSAAANCNQIANETLKMVTSSVPFGHTTALAKEINEATPDVGASSVSCEPATALAKELKEASPDVGRASVSYESATALSKQSNKAAPYVGTSMCSEPTTALAREWNEATPAVGTSSMCYEPTAALAKGVNEMTGVVEADSMMNSSILGQVESSSCVIPGVNQPEERVQAGTSQA